MVKCYHIHYNAATYRKSQQAIFSPEKRDPFIFIVVNAS